jgi:hypothetical protein
MNKLLFILLLVFTWGYAQTQSISKQEVAEKNKRSDNIISKNLEARPEAIEEIEKIIIEGQRDPENLPKKKKTIEKVFDDLLNKDPNTSGVTPNGSRYECLKNCVGPFCCAYSEGARTYSSPDSVHK